MSGTTVTYNNVVMTGCLTRRFMQAAQYDDSGTDLLFFRFTVRVVGYVHAQTGNTEIYTSPFGATGSAAEMHVYIRSLLMEPRKPFKMEVSGYDVLSGTGGSTITRTLLECNPSNYDSIRDISKKDVNNGPKPTTYEVTRIAGTNIFRVEFEIEICKVECNGQDAVENGSGVLSNRWSTSDDIDNNRMTTRTFQGRLRVSASDVNPHSFRQFVVPPLEQGFRRDRMTFVSSADSLNLDYTIIDKEIAYSAPYPATSWRYHYTESTGDGKMGIGEISVDLEGDRDVDKRLLIAVAHQIAYKQLISSVDGGSTLENLTVTDRYGDSENGVSLRATVRHNLDKEVIGVLVGKNMGRPLGPAEVAPPLLAVPTYNSNISFDPGLRGRVSYVAAFASYLQSPCSATHKFSDGGNSAKEGLAEGTSTTTITTYTSSGELPSEPAPYSSSHLTAPYTFYRSESRYTTHGHKVQLPIAKRSTDTAAAETTAVACRVGPTMTVRTLRVSAERVGAWPEFPTPADYTDESGSVCTLMDFKIFPGTKDKTPDLKDRYTADVEYVYALDRTPAPEQPLRTGVNPWLKDGSYGYVSFNNTTPAFLGSGTA